MLGSARIAGLREHKGEVVAKAEWPGIISKAESAKIRARLADPERRTNKAARRYLLGGLLTCGCCGEQLVARPRSGGQRRYACAKGPGFSGCGKTYIAAEPVEGVCRRTAILDRLDSPAARHAHSQVVLPRAGVRALVGGGRGRPGPARRARRRVRGEADHDGRSGVRRVSRSSSALSAARKQLRKGQPVDRARGLRRQRRSAPRALGRARPDPASTRSSRRSSITSRFIPAAPATTASTSHACARSGALTQQLRDPRNLAGSVTLAGELACWATSLDPGADASGLGLVSDHCAQQAGGPRHPSTLDDSQTRSGAAPM